MEAKIKNESGSFAALRVFETLKFLLKKPASVAEIIEHLESLDDKSYSKAVVYKYISTLKFAGINIENHKCKFEIKNIPFKIDFSKEDMNALSILKSIIELTPEKDLSKNINEFIYQLKMRYSFVSTNSESENNIKLKFIKPTEKQLEIIGEFEKYCEDKLRLKLIYLDLNNNQNTIICEPISVKFEDGNVIFEGFNLSPREFVEINSNQIIEVEQTPRKNTGGYSANTTIFKLTGKLAKRYTLRNNERIMNIDESSITVLNSQEPKDVLFLRLMRYGEFCEVISSRQDRETMKTIIQKTLELYD